MTPEQLRRFFLPNAQDDALDSAMQAQSERSQTNSLMLPGLDVVDGTETYEPIVEPIPQIDAISGAGGVPPRSVSDNPMLNESLARSFLLPSPGVNTPQREPVVSDDIVADEQESTDGSSPVTSTVTQEDTGITPGATTQEEYQAQTKAPVSPSFQPAPIDPMTTANWAVEQVNNDTAQLADLQKQNTAADVEIARFEAQRIADQVQAQAQAFKEAEIRQKQLNDLQNRTRAELDRRSDVLMRVAEQGVRQRPGASDRSAGRALLAVAAGMGVQSAANVFESALKDEERNERNDIERFNANIAALRTSFGAEGDNLAALGDAALRDQQIYDAQAQAREKLGIQQLTAKVAQMAPGKVKNEGEALIIDLNQKRVAKLLELADKQVQMYLLHRKMNAPVVVKAKAAGKMPSPPEKLERGPNESEAAWDLRRTAHAEEQAIYENEMAIWKALRDQELKNGGKPTKTVVSRGSALDPVNFFLRGRNGQGQVPQGSNQISSPSSAKITAAPTTSVQKQSTRPISKVVTAKDPAVVAAEQLVSGTQSAIDNAVKKPDVTSNDQTQTPKTRAQQIADDLKSSETARYDISFDGLKQPLRARDKTVINLPGGTDALKVRERASAILAFSDTANELAALLAAEEGNGKSWPAELAKTVNSGINFSTARQQMIDSKAKYLSQKKNVLDGMGAITGEDAPMNAVQLPEQSLYISDPKGQVSVLLDTAKTMEDTLTSTLYGLGYNVEPFKQWRADRRSTIIGTMDPLKGVDEAAEELGKQKQENAKAKAQEPKIKQTTDIVKNTPSPRLSPDGKGFTNAVDPDSKPVYERLATRDSEQKKLTSEIGAALKSKDNKKALELSNKIRDLQKKDVKDVEELVNRSIDKFGKVETKHRGTVDLSIRSGLTTRSGKNTKSINTFFEEAISPTLGGAYRSVFGDKEYIIKGSTDEERIANANNIKTLLFVTSGSALRAWVARDPIRFKDFKEMTVEDFNKKYPPKEMPPSEKKQVLDALKIEKDPKATKEEKDKARKVILKRWEQVEKHYDEGWND